MPATPQMQDVPWKCGHLIGGRFPCQLPAEHGRRPHAMSFWHQTITDRDSARTRVEHLFKRWDGLLARFAK